MDRRSNSVPLSSLFLDHDSRTNHAVRVGRAGVRVAVLRDKIATRGRSGQAACYISMMSPGECRADAQIPTMAGIASCKWFPRRQFLLVNR